MGAAVFTLTKNEIKSFIIFCSYVSAAIFIAGCQKNQAPESSASTEATIDSTSQTAPSMPTGLVKNPTRHTEQTANVTKWWDIAETKTAAQTARDEKIAREAKELKLAQEAKLVQESKLLAAKAAANIREPVKPPVVALQAPLTAKVVDVAPTLVAAVKTTPAPVQVAAELEVLKLISNAQPVFPIAAVKAGLTQGLVSARIFIEKNGNVSRVEIIDARPRKYFDREVIAALSTWKYAPLSSPQSKIIELTFKLDSL